jgi:REP element-mobilizing transposase RayT
MPDYPLRLLHETPGWVKAGELFHIRVRTAQEQKLPLTAPTLSADLLAAARNYHERGYWWCDLFLLMPDHVHALLAFPREADMSVVLRNWKRGTAKFHGVNWQKNYFDHRIRHDKEANITWWYIRRNPFVKSLCATEDAWPHWWSALTPPPRASAMRLFDSAAGKAP